MNLNIVKVNIKFKLYVFILVFTSPHCSGVSHIVRPYLEADLDEIEEEDELSEIEVEQAPPVVPIPAPVEPPVKRKRGRPPKNKPNGNCQSF